MNIEKFSPELPSSEWMTIVGFTKLSSGLEVGVAVDVAGTAGDQNVLRHDRERWCCSILEGCGMCWWDLSTKTIKICFFNKGIFSLETRHGDTIDASSSFLDKQIILRGKIGKKNENSIFHPSRSISLYIYRLQFTLRRAPHSVLRRKIIIYVHYIVINWLDCWLTCVSNDNLSVNLCRVCIVSSVLEHVFYSKKFAESFLLLDLSNQIPWMNFKWKII